MADARTGVAVGSRGTIPRTRDGGVLWQPPPGGSGATEYLKGVHMVDAKTGVAVGLEEAAGILALCSLGADRVPADVGWSAGLVALDGRGFAGQAGPVLDRLVGSGLIEQRDIAGLRLLRFALDPAAEYLAVMDRMRALGRERQAWEAELAALAAIAGYPAICEGYLQAFGVCYRAYRLPLRLPDLALPWED